MSNLIIPTLLPQRTRELCLRICDGDRRWIPAHLYFMQGLERRDEVLEWLVANGKTGREFLALIDEHGGLLKTVCFILKEINRDLEIRALIVGRDIR